MLLKVLFRYGGIMDMDENKIIQVNELLKNGRSLNQLDKSGELGCSRKAFKNRASKLNYQYNDDIKQFIKIDDIKSVTGSVTSSDTKVSVRKSKDVSIKNNTDLILQSFEDRLKTLESIVLHNNTNVTPYSFEIETRKDIISRSIKVSKSVMDSFNELAESKFTMYNKQDLLSKALLDFVEKYK